MLPKSQRIPRKDFSQILSLGRRYNSEHLLLYTRNLLTLGVSKFSFSVSKKVCKLAVGRNKFRRRGYNAIRRIGLIGPMCHIKPGYFCFFSFKKNSSSISFSLLEQEILHLLQDSGVIL